MCTYPDGSSFYLSGDENSNPNATVPDTNDILAGTLQASIDKLIESTDEDSNLRDVLEDLNADNIISDLMIKDESGEHAIEVIVAGETTHTTQVDDEDPIVETTALTDEAQEELESKLEEIVAGLTDMANAE